ncbi:hypothetical protein EK21DRAFT_103059 [Setomelanomma holmii]|uniref:MYND-type domain-containing protein n=1 Tax=Setomelanomma holmii TaxID=210430 RepID=A0A9P4LIZ8_9PLEO|nr:hypothetical protein EK21DRAFT_103059 [Setomelanomma holmii]
MARHVPGVSAFLNPRLSANNNSVIDGAVQVCLKDATQACSGCNLVQYCSKDCQVADWRHHKKTCKSPLMKDTWIPDWYLTGRKPALISDDVPFAAFGTLKFLWGNMPALEILQIQKNEGVKDDQRNYNLLFAATGDLRNLITTVIGIPDEHKGLCIAVLNDKEFVIVVRNAIMLLVALYFDAETAVPMMIHLWYSALLPIAMVSALRLDILPMIEDVCDKTKDKPEDSLQPKTFAINNRSLRLVLKKQEWVELSKYVQVPADVTAKAADSMRRRVMLAPERVDYRDLDMLFRENGILLPYESENSTLFHHATWPMKDSADPREGWERSQYMNFAGGAKADEHGALFFYLRDQLSKFCGRLRNVNIAFQMHCVNVKDVEKSIGDIKFDRIEMANICDRGYIGPHDCLQVFSKLLKPKSENPRATPLMIFLNAVAETEHAMQKTDMKTFHNGLQLAMRRLMKLMPMDQARFAGIKSTDELGRNPHFVRRSGRHDLLKNWDVYFDIFMQDAMLEEFAKLCELKIKKKHSLTEPWPFKVSARATTAEFEVLCASGFSGYERYMEFEQTK